VDRVAETNPPRRPTRWLLVLSCCLLGLTILLTIAGTFIGRCKFGTSSFDLILELSPGEWSFVTIRGTRETDKSFYFPGLVWKRTFCNAVMMSGSDGFTYSAQNVTWSELRVLPLIPLFLSGAYPCIALLCWRFRRPAPGKCRCGYDLTGNTSGRCPECGMVTVRTA
jgi:hypothetical protein